MEQWATGFASAHGRLPLSLSRSSWLLLPVNLRQVFFGRPLSSAVSWCPLNCAAGWAFWCHPQDMTCKSESPFPYDVLQSSLSSTCSTSYSSTRCIFRSRFMYTFSLSLIFWIFSSIMDALFVPPFHQTTMWVALYVEHQRCPRQGCRKGRLQKNVGF